MDYGGHFVGERIGDRLLLSYEGRNGHGHHLWMWECPKCGEPKGPSTLAHMKRNVMCNDCRNIRENNPRWKGHESMTGIFLGYYQASAAKRGHAWAVTPEELWAIWERQAGTCAYTGVLLTHGVDASIDRIDSSVGYVASNIQWVHRDINRMKSDFSEERFLELCGLVHYHTTR